MKKKTIIINCERMPDFIDVKALKRSIKMFRKSGIEVTIKYVWPIGTMNINI